MTSTFDFFEFFATRLKTKDGHELFSFPIDGKRIRDIATISRIKRDGTEIEGFQRNEVKSHIKAISQYVERDDAIIPNAIVIAFSDPDVTFKKVDSKSNAFGEMGVLKVPNHVNSDTRPAFIVDGQQRTEAIQIAQVSSFPIMVCAFKEGDEEYMAQQFYYVNSSKPLPKDLIAELLPNIPQVAPAMRPQQMAAELGNELAFSRQSPFCGIVRSTSSGEGFLALNSIINPLQTLITDPTSYIGMKCSNAGFSNIEEIKTVLFNYWTAVSQVFSHAWALKPTKSRLMHGTGMHAMFQVMTRILDNCHQNTEVNEIVKHIQLIAPHCHWTEKDNDWINIDGMGRNIEWKGLENTAQGKRILTAYITRKYVEALQNER